MNDVTVSMKMSPKATGALYLKSIRQGERIVALEKWVQWGIDNSADCENRDLAYECLHGESK